MNQAALPIQPIVSRVPVTVAVMHGGRAYDISQVCRREFIHNGDLPDHGSAKAQEGWLGSHMLMRGICICPTQLPAACNHQADMQHLSCTFELAIFGAWVGPSLASHHLHSSCACMTRCKTVHPAGESFHVLKSAAHPPMLQPRPYPAPRIEQDLSKLARSLTELCCTACGASL